MWAAHVGAGGSVEGFNRALRSPQWGGDSCGTRRQAAISSAREHVRTPEKADGGADTRGGSQPVIAPGAGAFHSKTAR